MKNNYKKEKIWLKKIKIKKKTNQNEEYNGFPFWIPNIFSFSD